MIRQRSFDSLRWQVKQRSLSRRSNSSASCTPKNRKEQNSKKKSPTSHMQQGNEEYVKKKWYLDEVEINKKLRERLQEYQEMLNEHRNSSGQNLSQLSQSQSNMQDSNLKTIKKLIQENKRLKNTLLKINDQIAELEKNPQELRPQQTFLYFLRFYRYQKFIHYQKRSQMVDWMILCLSSYKVSEDGFFHSVKLMDDFLRGSNKTVEQHDIHLIGVACMFNACRYESILHYDVETMFDRITWKKFKKTKILQKESEILKIVDLKLDQANLYNLVKKTSLKVSFKINSDQEDYLKQIMLYLSKMCLFDFDLAQQNTKLLAAAIYYIALKTLQKVKPTLKPQKRLKEISVFLESDDEEVLKISHKVLELARNFSTIYSNLTNLKKFHKFQLKNSQK